MNRLTKTFIDGIASPSRDTIIWEQATAGFGVRIRPGGRKTFIIQYRNADGRGRRMTLGRVGRLTLKDARSEAKRLLAQVDLGQDPVEDRRLRRNAPTLREFAERYMAEHSRPKKKPSSIASDEQLLRHIILPALGTKKVASITQQDVAAMHRAHVATPVQANRAVGVLSKMMNLAERWGVRPQRTNPCRFIDKYKEKPRDRYLSTAEIARLGSSLDEFERTKKAPPSAILVIRLLLLTGCRRGEIQSLRWDEVDLPGRRLRLADSKTGAKIVPLAVPALDLIARTPRHEGNPYVCVGQRCPRITTSLDKFWRLIRAHAGLEDVRLHDLRHTFASFGVANQFGLPVVGRLLGHTTLQTTERYAHLAIDPLLEAADQIAYQISAALEAKAPTHGVEASSTCSTVPVRCRRRSDRVHPARVGRRRVDRHSR